MDKTRRHLAILNLTGELLPELGDYFSSRKILVVDPLKSGEEYDWTHVLTKDVVDFTLINKTFEISVKERQIISLSKVDDLQNFTINNGNLILDDCWFKTVMGHFIMDKYLQSFGGITLNDNYPTFKEAGSFNIANPFHTGEYLDQMIQRAFEEGVNALAIRSYFDHFIMYITGLKNKEKAGLPFEVTYGVFEDIFAVQVHFFSPLISIMDVSASLNSMVTKIPEEYYLNTAVQSSDFFDFSFIPDVKKVIVTALWTKDQRIKFENRGLMFSSLKGGLPIALYENEDTPENFELFSPIRNDFSQKIEIPNYINEENTKKLIKGFKSKMDDVVVIPGGTEEEETITRISGPRETEDEIRLIKGEPLLQDFVQTVRGKFDEDQACSDFENKMFDFEKVVFQIANNIDEVAKDKNLKIRSLGEMLFPSIKKGLLDFAREINTPLDQMKSSDLDNFQNLHIPEILKMELLKFHPEETINYESYTPQMIGEIEGKLYANEIENERLKQQLKTLFAELKIAQEIKVKTTNMQNIVADDSIYEKDKNESYDEDEELRNFYKQKLKTNRSLDSVDAEKLSALLERESGMIANLKLFEQKSRKIEIESMQKESYFIQEMEKAERIIKMRELSLLKTKESFKKLVDKKDREISDLKSKSERFSRIINSGANHTNSPKIREFERQIFNLNKQIELYRVKISTLSSNKMAQKVESTSKDDIKKSQYIIHQLKNHLDGVKKENEKLQIKISQDLKELNQLRAEKSQLEQFVTEISDERESSPKTESVSPPQPKNAQELKKLQIQNQILETQVKDSQSKITNLENKLAELSKTQKAPTTNPEEGSRVKLTQLESSVKKLTSDLAEARAQVAESKKESNKLRQEKTALQNQLDKLSKDANKGKLGPKKGKVA